MVSLLLLSGCVEEDNTLDSSVVAIEETKPSYLEIEQAYEDSELYSKCEAYGEAIMDKTHQRYAGVKPYKHHSSADFIHSYETEDSYVYEMECTVQAHYQLNMFNHLTERFTQAIGELTINK